MIKYTVNTLNLMGTALNTRCNHMCKCVYDKHVYFTNHKSIDDYDYSSQSNGHFPYI